MNHPATIQQRSNRRRPWVALTIASLCVVLTGNAASAQVVHRPGNRVNHLWNQRTPQGLAAQWAATAGKVTPGRLQPVRVHVPSQGTVTFYQTEHDKKTDLSAPANAAISVGYVYRFRVADMPEYPGMEIYPSIEMIDQLHPPAGQDREYPVPIHITHEEIAAVQQGRLVTKIIYLEQPQMIHPSDLKYETPVHTIPNYKNLMTEADLRGRPIAILRIGSRVPAPHQQDREFFGQGGPLRLLPSTQQTTTNNATSNQQ